MRMIPDNMDDDEKGKLFVGGLSWETTQENLQRFFQRYGEVIDCVVMKNNESGRSRGFGFVTFSDPTNVNIVLQNGPHTLDGRTIDPKPCNPRTLQKPKKGGGYPKVFLGGLPSNITETDLRVFFGRYGKVMEVVIMYDQEKKKSRGFGFLSFEDDAAVDRVTGEHYINLNGKQVEIKKAEPRDGSGMSGSGSISGSNKMGPMGMGNHGSGDNGQWGPPQGAPMGMAMAGPNGQMGAPPMNMQMGAPNMMQGYTQGWSTMPAQQQNYGYGTPGTGPNSYQSWAGPTGHQGPPPPQWNNYATNPSQAAYDMYNSSAGPSGASAGNNWNSWNMQPPQNSAVNQSGELYTRTPTANLSGSAGMQTGSGMPQTASGQTNSSSKLNSDYSGYGTGYGNYNNDQSNAYSGQRSVYGNDGAATQPQYTTNNQPGKRY